MKQLVERCEQKCLAGQALTREEIIGLINIPVGSPEDALLRQAARRAAARIAADKAYIWCAVGMDYAPCAMNCRFCSFGEAWGLVKNSRHVTEDEILAHVRRYAEQGAAYIVLRTTEFYSLDELLAQVPRIRSQVPGDYALILNTGELDIVTASRATAAGVYGVYHALRLREGTDTPFAKADRVATMQSVTQADMTLISLVEPLGREHTAEEIADRFLTAVACGTKICGAMARFPVEGTPLGDTPMIDEDYLAHVIAALRLSGGDAVRDICVHPASAQALQSGANVVVVEAGAIPRDAVFAENDWADTGMERARTLLTDAGYCLSTPPAQPARQRKCACQGGNLEKFMQPIILNILSRGPQTGYAVQKQMAAYATYTQSAPDMAATYRFLKTMEKRGLVCSSNGLCRITDAGLHCLDDWKQTLRDYTATLTHLLAQLEQEN